MKISIHLLVVLLIVALPAIAEEHHDHQPHEPHDQYERPDAHDHAHDHDHSPTLSDQLSDTGTQNAVWTCPMHPQISRSQPGQCPICGMALVERRVSGGGELAVNIPGHVQQNMNLRTAAVERGQLQRRIDTVGRVQLNEDHLSHVHPRVEGWISSLDINTAGETIVAGQRLFTLYSFELINAQEEFLRALQSSAELARAARQRLAALGVQAAVIDEIRRRGEPFNELPWYAERGGYVQSLAIRSGHFVSPGTEMMVIADPDQLWVIADVYPHQMGRLSTGQHVEIVRNSRPGEIMHAEIAYIYPELDPQTRTLRARIVIDDPAAELRPGEWATVRIFGEAKSNVLYVPTEAVIQTGTSTRLIVREAHDRFRVREVHAGMASGIHTEILHGLSEGEQVVVSGQFLIDSEASLRAGHARLNDNHAH